MVHLTNFFFFVIQYPELKNVMKVYGTVSVVNINICKAIIAILYLELLAILVN